MTVSLGIEHPCGTCDQILLPVGNLRSLSMERPLRREDGSAICSAITQWPESRRTRNLTLLVHLKLPQPGGGGQVPVCISPRNRVAQLYPRVLGSFTALLTFLYIRKQFITHRKRITSADNAAWGNSRCLL
jgi:hypothetical protein